MTEITTVKFDGVYVTLLAADGSVVGSAMAVSGVKGYQNPVYSDSVGKGPIPAGAYTLEPASIDFRNFYEDWIPGWGMGYVNLIPEPGTNTFGRTGFNLHGSLPGNGYGSLGCIDLNDQDSYILGLLSQFGAERVRLIVDYSENMELLSKGHPAYDPSLLKGDLHVRCFPAATSVMMADGGRKAIKDIKVGDVVMAYNPTPGFVSWRHGGAVRC